MTTTATMISTPTVTPTAMPIIIPLSPPPPDTDIVKQMRDHCIPRRGKTTTTSMLDLLTVGPKFTRPACRAAAAIGRYLLPAPDLSSKPAGRRCCCRATGQTDGRTEGRTLDRFMRLTSYYQDRIVHTHTHTRLTALCPGLPR